MSPSQTHVVREVNDQTDGDQNSQVYGEAERVEEAGKLPLFPRIRRVKLVGSKRGHTWFYPCWSQCNMYNDKYKVPIWRFDATVKRNCHSSTPNTRRS
jgi:hypothetical protein